MGFLLPLRVRVRVPRPASTGDTSPSSPPVPWAVRGARSTGGGAKHRGTEKAQLRRLKCFFGSEPPVDAPLLVVVPSWIFFPVAWMVLELVF